MSDTASTVRGVIKAFEGEIALVEIAQRGCGRCHEEGGCGGQQLTQMFCATPRRYRVPRLPELQVGDAVEVAMDASIVRRSATLAYVYPVLALIGGALLGTAVAGDLGGMLGAGVGLVLGFAWMRLRSTQLVESAGSPHILPRH